MRPLRALLCIALVLVYWAWLTAMLLATARPGGAAPLADVVDDVLHLPGGAGDGPRGVCGPGAGPAPGAAAGGGGSLLPPSQCHRARAAAAALFSSAAARA